ncbi:hypothetical protein etchr1_040106_242625 [Eimeria tenella]|uniref:Uncharacterized protein n=1 Tax=Eimeria tenella TaxID=5802 RepID=C8TDR0_EIMTE|nr:hypothetical protein etchr1_040106_242625 [Eimeria tenella]
MPQQHQPNGLAGPLGAPGQGPPRGPLPNGGPPILRPQLLQQTRSPPNPWGCGSCRGEKEGAAAAATAAEAAAAAAAAVVMIRELTHLCQQQEQQQQQREQQQQQQQRVGCLCCCAAAAAVSVQGAPESASSKKPFWLFCASSCGGFSNGVLGFKSCN